MKIWIVSSRPYLEEFEKMTSYWPKTTDFIISPIYNYGLNLNSTKKFFKDFRAINPDLIVTDHGYIGYFPIKLFSCLKKKPVKIFFFLRGNFWLEKKNYSKNVAKVEYEYFNIKISINDGIINFRDAHDQHMPYFQKTSTNGSHSYEFNNIWPGNYIINHNGHQLKIKLKETETIEKEGLKVEITKIKDIHNKKGLELLKEYFRIFLQKTGWDIALKHSNKIIAVCDYLRTTAPRKLIKKTVISPIGIEIKEPKEEEKIEMKHPAVVLIQNHQIKEKSDALVSFKKVIDSLPNVNFYISRGLIENRNNANYKKVVETLKNSKNVFFRDILSHNKMSYLKHSDLYILRSGLDCTPATVIEASLAGKPTIASKVGGVPEMVEEGQTGWTIKNDDDSQWIEKINLLISNSDLAKQMGQEAKKYTEEKYSMAHVADRFYKIITEEG